MPSKTNGKIPFLNNNTFANEAKLPNLPVPSINNTLHQLESSLIPLLTDDELQILRKKIDDFKKSKVSKILQNHLLKFQQNEDCYLDHLNLDHILIDHKALPRNPFLILENDPLGKINMDQSQSDRAAVLTISALKFISSLRQGHLSADKTLNGELLTMKPYLNLFGTTRISEFESIKSKTNYTSDYILILSKSQFYTLKVLNDDNQLLFTIDELSQVLDQLVKEIDYVDNPNSTAIGSITSDSFKHWKNSRDYLQKEFKENLNRIDAALFVLVLDHSSPNVENSEELAKTISVGSLNIDENGVQTGSCTSRWYDKLQLIVTKNSTAGIIWDSFTSDGTCVLRFTSDIFTDSVLRLADGNYSLFPNVKTEKLNGDYPKPEKLHWNFGTDAQTSLHLAETRLTDLICTHSTNTKTLKFGRNFSKKIGVKADSLIQIALQISHYALYGRAISTIEPVSTRFFNNSRSELYPVQNDLITKTCQIFVSDSSPLMRWQSFIDCCKFHSKQLSNCSRGQGFEKHLKALQNVYLQRDIFNQISPELNIPKDAPIPPLLFDDVIFPLFIPDLIASNCGNPAMRLFGLTPAVSNGFGIGYIIKDDSTEICLISQYRQGDRFLSTLNWVMHQLQHIWKNDVGIKKIPHAHELDDLKHHDHNNHQPTHPLVQSTKMSRSTTLGSTSEDEVDLALGGYGYFDIEDLEIRSNYQSKSVTPNLSSHNSSMNLKNSAIGRLDMKELDKNLGRNLKNDRIKDFFEKHKESGDDDEDHEVKINEKFDRGAVGRKIIVDEFL